jgi:prefoldin subunit 5
MNKVDKLQEENKQLRDELEAARAKLEAVESYMAKMRQSDDSVREARMIMSRLNEEADKRISD